MGGQNLTNPHIPFTLAVTNGESSTLDVNFRLELGDIFPGNLKEQDTYD